SDHDYAKKAPASSSVSQRPSGVTPGRMKAGESSHPLLRCEIPCPLPGTDRDGSVSLPGGAASCGLDALEPEHRNRRYPPSPGSLCWAHKVTKAKCWSVTERGGRHIGELRSTLKRPTHHAVRRKLATSLATAASLRLGKGHLLVSIRLMDTTKKRGQSEAFSVC
ncbi:LOW QUALITY PROTEIN: uncharacterized protein KIAA0087-like, partial [Saimiri boliviensis]|uniref:LOW QUALITY PROTEIN: uncharacterized protein KIAA0087-like n=1 Tax=Saimiri boliviensis TaxID=27679 RepID=UPI00027FA2C5